MRPVGSVQVSGMPAGAARPTRLPARECLGGHVPSVPAFLRFCYELDLGFLDIDRSDNALEIPQAR